MTLASTSKTNTSPFSAVIPAGEYNVIITATDSQDDAPLLEQVISLMPVAGSGSRKGNYTIELSGEASLNCNAVLKMLPRALQRCMFQLQHSRTAVFDTAEICEACDELREFSTLTLEGGVHRQHDAAEFVGVLLEYLEDEMPHTNLLARLKGFFTRTVVTLWFPRDEGYEDTVVAGTIEESFGPFGPVDISAKSTGGSLEECLQDASQMNDDIFSGLEVADGWTTATRTQVIKVLPRVLVMSLGRFKYNMVTGRTDKLNYKISFPQDLDMTPYTEEHIMAARDGAQLPPPCWFELVGVITHQGTASAGHYFSYAKHDGSWFKLNDERVAEVTVAALEKECYGDGVSNTNAYMLVYRAKDVGAEDNDPTTYSSEDAAEKAAMLAKMAMMRDDTHAPDVNSNANSSPPRSPSAGGAAGGNGKAEHGMALGRTSTLSAEVDSENDSLLRQASLFDDDVINLILTVSRMHLMHGSEDWTTEIPLAHTKVVFRIAMDVLSRVLARWKNLPKWQNRIGINIEHWIELLRMAVRPDPWPEQVSSDDEEENAEALAVKAAVAKEATESAWRMVTPWLVVQWRDEERGKDWSSLMGPHVDGGLRVSFCGIVRAAQTALTGMATLEAFEELELAHGGTIGAVLADLVCAEGVSGSVGFAGTEQIELALAAIVERGERVNACSVRSALADAPEPIQVKLHRAAKIGVAVWNLLPDESIRVYHVKDRDQPRANWEAMGKRTIEPIRWSDAPYRESSGQQGSWCAAGSMLVVSINGVHVAQYTVTSAERQHVFVQRGDGADPTAPPPVEMEPEPEPSDDDEASNNNTAAGVEEASYVGNSSNSVAQETYPVGSKVEVLFEADNRFYEGTVTEIDPDSDGDDGVKVEYDPTTEYPETSNEFIRHSR